MMDPQQQQPPATSDWSWVTKPVTPATVPPTATPTTSDWSWATASKPSSSREAATQSYESALKVAKGVVNALPAVGGAIGGLVGGVPGAALGGAAGQGYKTLINNAKEIPGAIKDVTLNAIAHPQETAAGIRAGATAGGIDAATEGAFQGGMQMAGAGVAKAGGVMAKWLMNRATTRVTQKLMQDFPELSDTLIDNALTVSKGGYEKAVSMLKAAKAKANWVLRRATNQGAEIPVQMTDDLAESLKTAILENAVKGGTVGKVAAGQPVTAATTRLDPTTQAFFQQIEAAAKNRDVLKLSPVQADALKTQLQKESRALYANRVAPNGQKAMGMDATERAEFATRLNEAIEAVATGYKAANAEAQPLIGAKRGIAQAIRPNGNLYQAMVRPAVGAVLGEETSRRTGNSPIAGAVIGAVLTSPAGMSREAIILAHPAVQAVLRQVPRVTAEAFREFIGTQLPALLRPRSDQEERDQE